jgi:hypothetical protein
MSLSFICAYYWRPFAEKERVIYLFVLGFFRRD